MLKFFAVMFGVKALGGAAKYDSDSVQALIIVTVLILLVAVFALAAVVNALKARRSAQKKGERS